MALNRTSASKFGAIVFCAVILSFLVATPSGAAGALRLPPGFSTAFKKFGDGSGVVKIATSMKKGDVLHPGQVLIPAQDGFGFVAGIGVSGSFDVYSPSMDRIVGSSGTRGGTTLVFQTDGNVVLRNINGQALWGMGSVNPQSAIFDIASNGEPEVIDDTGRQVIRWNNGITGRPSIVIDALVSPSGHYSLISQSDGNVVIYHYYHGRNNPIWNTHTAGHPYPLLILQSDGNLALRMYGRLPRNNTTPYLIQERLSGKVLWISGAQSKFGGTNGYDNTVNLQNDGNLVVRDYYGRTVWSSHTAGKK